MKMTLSENQIITRVVNSNIIMLD